MRCALVLPLFTLLGACGVETIVAARTDVDAGHDAGGARDCAEDSQCASGEYCEKPDCAAERGQCELRPTVCRAEPMPVCGCDGITYFNDCLRQASGVSLADARECGPTALCCAGPNTCPADAFCAALAPPDLCPLDQEGRCWVLPSSCGQAPMAGDRFSSCDGSLHCVDACTAIRSELAIRREWRCPLDDPKRR